MSNKILTKENVPFIFGTVCAIAGLLFGISAIDKYIESKAQPTPTETELTEVIPVATETLTESQVEVIQLEVSSAAAAGQAVADLQNQLVRASGEEISGIFDQMNPYFDVQQGVWSDVPNATFVFNTTYDFTDGIIAVSWTATDDTGNEVVYVFADYNANTQMFSNVEQYRTSYAFNLLNTDGDDYGYYPGVIQPTPEETEETAETEPTAEPTPYEYEYEIGDVNTATGDVVSGYVVQGEGDIRPVMTATLPDGTSIYYTRGNDGNYYVCNQDGTPSGNDLYDPSTGELY